MYYISASVKDSNEIPPAIPMFSSLGNTTGLLRTLLDVRVSEKLKMAAITGSGYRIICISASMHDSNETSTCRATSPDYGRVDS